MKPSGKRKTILIVLSLCCLLVFCVSAYKVVSQLIQDRREARAFEGLTSQFGPEYTPMPVEPEDTAPSGDTAGTPSGTGVSETGEPAGPEVSLQYQPEKDQPEKPVVYRFSKYDALYEQNNDLFGWISIDDTIINYPVMHTPDDPEYYLHRNFEKKESSSGTPFLAGACYKDCGNYVVYGHHMKNGSMFRALLNYKKKSFWEEHPIIHFDTVDEPGDYEIIAAFYSRVYRVDEVNVFRFYNYTQLTDEETFNEYISQVNAAALYKTGVTAEFGDQLLTLSTCSYHVDNGRFVVVAKRISNGTEN